MNESREYNAKRNLVSGFFLRIVLMLFPFANRTLILYILGAEYQGLGSLFSAILQVLNLTDLGFSSAVIFALYKPIAQNDIKRVNAYMAYLKKAYKIVGLLIVIVGASIMPFLGFLIKGSYPQDVNLYLLYGIYLTDAGISYLLFAYKNSLLIAEQRSDVVNKVTSVVTTIRYLAQFAILFLTKNYYAYIVLCPIFSILTSIIIQFYSKKLFPDIKPVGRLQNEDRLQLNKQLKGVVVGKISDVARNSFDSIILSSLLGLVTVAIYNNYYYIYTTIYGFALILSHAIQAGIGDSIGSESVTKNYSDLNLFNFISNWVSGVFSICLVCLYQPFMAIWVGEDLLLSNYDMVLFCIYFYAINMNNIRNEYLNGCGLWWENRQWFIIEAIANLLLNIVLGLILGVTGVLIATIITIILFNYIARTNTLFKYFFKRSPSVFYRDQCFYALITILVGGFSYYIESFISINGLIGLFIKLFVTFAIANGLFFLIYRKNPYFGNSVKLIQKSIKKQE